MSRRVSRALSLLFVVLFVATLGGQASAASKKKPPGDPPGNNGTVKIEQGDQTDSDLGNEPHGDQCKIWLEFYGFDEGQKADIIFTGQPPSAPKDTPVDEYKDVVISTTPAGGGQDKDTTYFPINLASKLKDLKEQPQQGYHLKLTTIIKNSDGSAVPGGTKHKVFWMAGCPEEQQAPPPQTQSTASTLRIAKAQEGTGEGPFSFDLNCDHAPLNQTFTLKAGEKLDVPNVPAGTTCAVTETDKKGAESTTITEDPVFGAANDGTVKTVADKATVVTFKNKFATGNQVIAPPANDDIRPPSAAPAGGGSNTGTNVEGTNAGKTPGSDVSGEQLVAPAATNTLPRTGGDPRPMTTTGLSALAAGLVLLAGSRRRRA